MSYQNISGISKKYERDCQERWELIKQELACEGVVLDIGAAEGFFLKKIAEETNLLVVGIEKDKKRIAFQHRWLSDKYNGGIISCHYSFSTEFSGRLARTPEWFDTILLLSTLHWINNDEFLKNIASMAGKVIVEIPNLSDYKATGQKFLERVRNIGSEKKYFADVTKRDVRLLGQVKAHTYPTRNLWIIEGKRERRPDIPHLNFQGKSRATYYQRFDGRKLTCKIIKGSNVREGWLPGVNLSTLAEMRITFPPQRWWQNRICQSVSALRPEQIKGDMRIHNVIVSRDKLTWIDLNHYSAKNTIFEDIKNMVTNY